MTIISNLTNPSRANPPITGEEYLTMLSEGKLPWCLFKTESGITAAQVATAKSALGVKSMISLIDNSPGYYAHNPLEVPPTPREEVV